MIESVSARGLGQYDLSPQELEASEAPADPGSPAANAGFEGSGAPYSHPYPALYYGSPGLAGFPNPLPATAPAAPATIGGASAPALEQGKSHGPAVSDLQSQLNVWREHQWKAEGNPGWPKTHLGGDGKFDATTRDAGISPSTVATPPV